MINLPVSLRIMTDQRPMTPDPPLPGWVQLRALLEADGMEAEAWSQGPNWAEAMRQIGEAIDRRLPETLSKRRLLLPADLFSR
jgi:hypothetical protein